MELHFTKGKGSKSEITCGCSLNGQIKWWIQKIHERFVTNEKKKACGKWKRVLCTIQGP